MVMGAKNMTNDGSAACPPDRRVQPGETEIRTAILEPIGPEILWEAGAAFASWAPAPSRSTPIAAENRRGISTARGCKWSAAQVRDVVIRFSR